MADTYEAFYNGKPLNPNRGLPTMTYAQAEDCGLTESERLWCCTDGEDTPITADDIPYDSNNSVKDKIDEISGNPNYKIEVGNFPITYNNQTGSVIGIKITVLSNNRYMIIGTELAGGTFGGGSFVYNSWTGSTIRFAI